MPFLGRLQDLGGRLDENDATIYSRWASFLHTDIFQVKLGNQLTVVVSSVSAIRDLWVQQTNALIDRPHQPGFVDKLGLDVSGSRMTEQIRRCRAAAMRALGKPQWPGYYQQLEKSASSMVSDLFVKGENGRRCINTFPYLRLLVFDLVLSLTYGARQKGVDDPLILALVKSIREISSHRSSTVRYRDFIPLLRILPETQSRIVAAEKVRQQHLDILYSSLRRRLKDGEQVSCIAAHLGSNGLSYEEIDGTCKSLLQAAPGTVASGMYQCIAWLCSERGQVFQPALYETILDSYNGDRDKAWEMSFREEAVPLVMSLCKETLRYYTVTPYATPRSTVCDVEFRKWRIPRGTTLIMNAQEANHDKSWYGEDAWDFLPERFIDDTGPLPHLTYGAGSRICPAVAISNRIMYAAVIRLTLAFQMRASTASGSRKPSLDMINFSDGHTAVLSPPREYDCNFEARDEEWLKARLQADSLTGAAS